MASNSATGARTPSPRPDATPDSFPGDNAFSGTFRYVEKQRSVFGAVQNRLAHTLNNLQTYRENLLASESRIRDVDMAKEMVEYTKFSILAQAGQSMLSQANQAPQSVLSLLR